jgi:hypothetical protein
MRVRPFLAMVLLTVTSAALCTERPIGRVKTYRPESRLVRNGVEGPIGVSTPIEVGDRIITQAHGAVGIIFIDGSVLSLGPRTELVIDDFTFHPAKKDVSFLSRLLQGTASYLSGAIGRISPGSVKFRTPTAVLGLRGTKILIKVE